MDAMTAGRAAASAVLAGVLTLCARSVLPPVPAWLGAVVLAVWLVHHLAPARPHAARPSAVRPRES